MVNRNFSIYAWLLLGYNLLVILWGAYVRATGSGAGCGNHWPLCNGEVIPKPEQMTTLIEFAHRVSTSLDGLLVIGLVVWAFRSYPKKDLVRLGAVFSLIFVIIEGLVGAALVRLELVADNASLARGWWIAGHLANTHILLAWLALTAWWASGGGGFDLRKNARLNWLFGIGLFGMLVLGMSGAIAALGDTLFPATSFQEGLRQEFSSQASVLLRLRVFHPFIASLVGLYWFLVASAYVKDQQKSTRTLASALIGLIAVQLAAGVVNVLLLAPVWMQIVHLLLADLVWIAAVLLAADIYATAEEAREANYPAQQVELKTS